MTDATCFPHSTNTRRQPATTTTTSSSSSVPTNLRADNAASPSHTGVVGNHVDQKKKTRSYPAQDSQSVRRKLKMNKKHPPSTHMRDRVCQGCRRLASVARLGSSYTLCRASDRGKASLELTRKSVRRVQIILSSIQRFRPRPTNWTRTSGKSEMSNTNQQRHFSMLFRSTGFRNTEKVYGACRLRASSCVTKQQGRART